MGAERHARIVKAGLGGGVEEVSVCEVLQGVAPRVLPVVEDLGAEDVASDAAVVGPSGVPQVIVAHHDGVDVLDFEGGMVEALLAHADAEEGVMIDGNVAAVAAVEGEDDVLRVSQEDFIR
jgi:hypothetical protein